MRIMSNVLLAMVLSISVLVGNVCASTIIYNDFSDASALTFNGSAIINNNALRLTTSSSTWQAGSVFLTDHVSLVSSGTFSTYFEFQITNSAGDEGGADGICYVMQSQGNTALGDSGGNIGYRGVAPSIGIEFDTYQNAGESNGNHMAINLNGNMDSASVASYAVPTVLNNGNVWHVWIDYDGSNKLLEARLSESILRPNDPQLSYSLDLLSIIDASNVYAGFTSGTAGGYGDHDVLSWRLTSVPIPAAIWLFASGMFTLISTVLRRRDSI